MSELYHYTSAHNVDRILRDGFIRAHRMELYRTALRTDRPFVTPPLVWLTTNPILDATVLVKMSLDGLGIEKLSRIVLPGGYTDLSLGEWVESEGMDPEWWHWVIRTGAMAGSHYTTWRIVPHDVPRTAWLRAEMFSVFDGERTKWTRIRRGPSDAEG